MRGMKTNRDAVRAAFSERLNRLLDHYDVPAKYAGRQIAIKTKLGVSQESARKWLEGESFPREATIAKICEAYPCRKAWLHHGEEPMLHDKMTQELMERWNSYSDQEKADLLAVVRRFGGQGDDPSRQK